jgi:hypothetical protein
MLCDVPVNQAGGANVLALVVDSRECRGKSRKDAAGLLEKLARVGEAEPGRAAVSQGDGAARGREVER